MVSALLRVSKPFTNATYDKAASHLGLVIPPSAPGSGLSGSGAPKAIENYQKQIGLKVTMPIRSGPKDEPPPIHPLTQN
ncbi:hypothetical protein Vi05172_g8177 [Venturia inaequalis]|nr:hypothetical protein Vi05172_g8177 [Venturia inaequalis]